MNNTNTSSLSSFTDEQIADEFIKRLAKTGKVEIFYTTNTPYNWSSGPSSHFYDKDDKPFSSLLDAYLEAKDKQDKGSPRGSKGYIDIGVGINATISNEEE